MVLVEVEGPVGVVRVGRREAAKLDRYFDRVMEQARSLESTCDRVFICFPSVEAAKRFRMIYRERIGELCEQDVDNDEEVILKFIL